MALSPADRASLRSLLEESFADIAHIFARLDARDAQLTKVEDREYILPRVLALPDGFGTVTALVNGALREWLARAGREELEKLPSGERGASGLIDSLGRLLQDKGDLDGAEGLYREALAAFRETLGDRHPSTLISIWGVCKLLEQQGEEDEAKRLCREAVDGAKAVLGAVHPFTKAALSNPWGIR